MIFTLTDRNYNALDVYETDDYLIGKYIGSILETLDIEVAVSSLNAEHWIQGHYIMCTDKNGRNYWFTIYDADDSLSDDYKKLTCFSGTIDIVSEEFPPIKATSPQPFSWYMSKIFSDTGIVIGINEISDMKRTLEFEGTNHTNVEMLQFVLNGFDNADAQLEVEFDGVRPKKIVLNVYKHLGAIEPQELLTSEVDNLEELERKGSISELATGLRPTGEETDGKALTLKGKYFEEKDSDGNILYYSPKDRIEIFSVQGRQNFFVDLPNKSNGEFDGYIVRDYSSQAKTQDALWREALIKLKKIDHASIEYEAKGYITCDLGDNVQIVAHEMKPPVMISARVTEYKFNDDDNSRNEYKFNNFVELESNMSELDKIIADIKKGIDYVLDMKVDYAIGNDNVTVPVTWVEKEPNVPQGKYLWTRTSTYMSKGAVIPAYSITYVAIDGKPGENGLDTYIDKTWSWSSDGTDRFTTKYPKENFVTKKENIIYTVSMASGLYMEKDSQGTGNDVKLTLTGNKEYSYLWYFGALKKYMPYTKVGETYTLSFDMKTNRKLIQSGITYYSTMNECDVIRTNFDVLNVEKSSSEKVRIYVVFKPRTVAANSNYNLHFQSNADSTITPSWIVDLENLAIQEGDTFGGVSVPSPLDDFDNAYPKYEGYYSSHNPVKSTNPSDYTWTPIPREPGKDGEPGQNAAEVISGSLSNDSIILSATSTGVVSDYSKAYGDFVVYEGQNKLVNGVTYSKVSETGMTSSINASGRYTVTNITSDTAMAIYRATYKGVQIDKQIIAVKNKQGNTGNDGVGIKSTTITYQASASGTVIPNGTWVAAIPTVSDNQYLWTRTVITYTDNTSSTGYSVSKMGGKGATGTGVSSSVVTYASSTSGVTPPSNWSTNIPTVVEGSYLWTRTVLTFSDNTTNTSYSVAKQGVTGPQGPPTGINTSATVPSNPYVNMLWQNTGTNNGYITGVTYQWNGAKWNIYIFTAENIAVTSLSAISSNIGMITAGVINGAVIISEFQRDLWEGSGIYKKGEIQITDGQMITTFDEIQRSTNTILAKGLIISDENGFSISRVTPAGQLLNGTTYATDYIGMSDVANGFVGKITAANLTETPWITLPLRTGYSIAEDNPPQYRIIYNLDGTKEIVFRGQFKKNSGTMNASSEQWPIQIPESIYPATTIMSYGATDNGNGCRLSITTFGRFAAIIGVTASNYVDISSMSYQIKNYTRSVDNA